MGSVFYTGQVSRYIGATPLTVNDSVLSAASNVNRMFTGQVTTTSGINSWIPGLPDFLQGWTEFIPGSSYMVFTRGLSVLPLSAPSTADFIPYSTAVTDEEALILKSGVSFFVSTSAASPNIFTGPGIVTSAFAVLSSTSYVSRVFEIRADDSLTSPLYNVYGPGLPEFLQGFTTLEQNSSYITFFQNQQ